MSASFLRAMLERADDTAARPLPTDDALAALELHGPILELGAGAGIWSALLRERNLVRCVCFDERVHERTYTDVQPGGLEVIEKYADSHALLLVHAPLQMLDELAALKAYTTAGGRTLAYVGALCGEFSAMLAETFERQITVSLSNDERLTFWMRRPPRGAAGAAAFPTLEVRLELVDMEAPDWAAAPAPAADGQPSNIKPEIGGRKIRVDGMGGPATTG